MVHIIPAIPAPPLGQPWPPNVLTAMRGIRDCFAHASECLTHQNSDPVRLVIQLENMANQCIPLLDALAHTPNLPVPIHDWLHTSAIACRQLVQSLLQARAGARGM